VKFPTLPAGHLRHWDHQYEWTRAEFRASAERVADRVGSSVRFLALVPENVVVGAPTQIGVLGCA
jgi:hypothetical protein